MRPEKLRAGTRVFQEKSWNELEGLNFRFLARVLKIENVYGQTALRIPLIPKFSGSEEVCGIPKYVGWKRDSVV